MATAPDHGAIAKGDGAAHPLGYVQSADPGAIGADRPWCDTTDAASGHYVLKIRNAADGGWLTLNASHLGGDAAALFAKLASPTFTGTPAAPTAAAGTNTTQVATTAFVRQELLTPVNSQSGTSYTLVLSDSGKIIECSNAGAITVTVPPNSSVAFPVGTRVAIAQTGAGQVTVAAGSGVTIKNGATWTLKTAEQEAVVELLKIATDTWRIYGDRELV
jgi:hypothetical protein